MLSLDFGIRHVLLRSLEELDEVFVSVHELYMYSVASAASGSHIPEFKPTYTLIFILTEVWKINLDLIFNATPLTSQKGSIMQN